MSHVGALILSLMVIIRRWRLPTICITVRTLSIQWDILACWCALRLHWTTHRWPPKINASLIVQWSSLLLHYSHEHKEHLNFWASFISISERGLVSILIINFSVTPENRLIDVTLCWVQQKPGNCVEGPSGNCCLHRFHLLWSILIKDQCAFMFNFQCKRTRQWCSIINIATGETSQAITPLHFFDNFNFHH